MCQDYNGSDEFSPAIDIVMLRSMQHWIPRVRNQHTINNEVLRFTYGLLVLTFVTIFALVLLNVYAIEIFLVPR